ncbi:tail assembly chaperone [Candidatus Enterococcus ferrettii]|uniref:tail assembly chaperone n=1 Tax=Candidatus Enterococcus ferrettii TaxID=2815324 RepID=UPI001A9C176F|nr:tail assembly chaperone [Enterococcus sp. 665A]MBO1341897.1 hypothetical protein [Enterococcus sp. 665A]
MKITINDKDYVLHFGLDFIETLDNTEVIKQNGMEVGMGTQMNVGLLADYRNPKYLVQIISAALITEDSQPSISDIRKWVEEQENIPELIDAFLLQLQQVSLLVGMVNWKAVKVQNKDALKKFLK